MTEKITYCGEELTFRREVETISEAQAWLDWYRNHQIVACCTHASGKHQIYSNNEKPRGNKNEL